MYACGHEESSSTRIGTEREPVLMGILQKLCNKKPPGFLNADSAQLCSSCRKGLTAIPAVSKRGNSTKSHRLSREKTDKKDLNGHPDPLRFHPISSMPEPQELEEDDATLCTNKFAEIPKYGAHNFTRKHPDDVIEMHYNHEEIPNPFPAPTKIDSSLEVARKQGKVSRIVHAINNISKKK